jgi:hypothetical protein
MERETMSGDETSPELHLQRMTGTGSQAGHSRLRLASIFSLFLLP